MTEEEAQNWFATRYSTDVLRKLEGFVSLLREEAERQSLIARSTFDEIWARHMLDSAQLALLCDGPRQWLDVGSGGGLPGVVLAILNPAPIRLVEPRKLRAAFLERCAAALSLPNIRVGAQKVQSTEGRFGVVTARAVSSVDNILRWTEHLVSRETHFLLPRGRTVAEELENARRAWHGTFHVEQSITDPNSGIIVATGVRRR